jgi:tetratricopeptide (TPR) repeat protein
MKRVRRLPELTTKAKIGVILIAVVVVAIALVFVVTTLINQQLSKSAGYDVGQLRKDFAGKDSQSRKIDALQDAKTALKAGEDKRATDTYEQAIEAESDPAKKVKLAIDQSLLLYNFNQFDKAVEVAKKAESYNSDKFYIADWLGRLYENGKQYSDAATYYGLAGSLAGSPTNDTGFTKKYYDTKVTEMKSLVGKS